MKSSLLLLAVLRVLQSALFQCPVSAAFLQNKNDDSLSKKPPCQEQQRCQIEVSSSPLPTESSPAPSPFPELNGRMPPIPMRQRHPLFRDTNAVSKPMTVPHPDLWRGSLLSHQASSSIRNIGPFWDAARNFFGPNKEQHGCSVLLNNIHIQFDNPAVGARQLLDECGVLLHPSSHDNESSSSALPPPEAIMAETETIRHLTDVLSYFQTVADSSNGPSDVKCIARIVSTVGSAGIKCPRWHADYVPVRLVMSIVGPGCEYIPETRKVRPKIVNRHALNNLDEDDTVKANDIIVPLALLKDAGNGLRDDNLIKYAKEGEAVLLMGKAWEDITDGSFQVQNESVVDSLPLSNDDELLLAAVHRSPTLLPKQERILLTVDLVDWV